MVRSTHHPEPSRRTNQKFKIKKLNHPELNGQAHLTGQAKSTLVK